MYTAVRYKCGSLLLMLTETRRQNNDANGGHRFGAEARVFFPSPPVPRCEVVPRFQKQLERVLVEPWNAVNSLRGFGAKPQPQTLLVHFQLTTVLFVTLNHVSILVCLPWILSECNNITQLLLVTPDKRSATSKSSVMEPRSSLIGYNLDKLGLCTVLSSRNNFPK